MDTSFVVGWLAGTLLPLGAIWLLFRLVLRGERCFGYNRALLLLAPVVALALPLLPRPQVADWIAPAAAPMVAMPVVALPTPGVTAVAQPVWQPGIWLIYLYLLGVLMSLSCLVYRYVRLRRATRRLPREPRPGYVLAYTGGRLPTSSFGHTIFWDETADLTPTEATSVLAHELGHVRQGHSFDILWLEVWRALLWFNPFAHLLLPALRLTHELLADWEALLLVASPADALAPAAPYPALLARLAVRRVAGPEYSSLIQSFAFSFTLTRIAMLHNQIPVRRWKQWLALPLLSGVFLGASQVVAAQTVPASAANQARRDGLVGQKVREAMHQDSLRTGGKFEPGTSQQVTVLNSSGKPGDIKVVVRRGKYSETERTTQAPPPPAPPIPYEKGKAPAPVTSNGEPVYTYVEQMPALPSGGSMGGIMKQIQDNLVYPSGPHQEGMIFASFTVGSDGAVRDPKIIKGLSPTYDEAVLAAIQKLARFVPGVQNGRPVAVSFTVPVSFKEKP
jgi:TonB family protein